MINKNIKLVFIVGCSRSGTTLLRNVLEQHPLIATTPELKFFNRILASKKRIGELDNSKARVAFQKHVMKKLSACLEDRGYQYNIPKICEELLYIDSYKDYFFNLAVKTIYKNNYEILVEKTPVNVFFLEEIFNYFPNAKVIHMLRDGRDVCASMIKRWDANLIHQVAYWDAAVSAYDCFLQKNPDKHNQMLQIKYESFVDNPKKYLEEIFAFLNTDRLSEIELKDILSNTVSNSSFNKKKIGIARSSHFLDQFSKHEQELIVSLQCNTLIKKGYDAPKIKPELGAKIQFYYNKMKIKTNMWIRRMGYYWLLRKIFRA